MTSNVHLNLFLQTIVTGAGDETLRFWNVFPSVKTTVSEAITIPDEIEPSLESFCIREFQRSSCQNFKRLSTFVSGYSQGHRSLVIRENSHSMTD